MRSRLLLPTLVLVTTLTGVVSSLGAPLVPEIAARYDVPLRVSQWTLTAPVLVGAVATPLVGRLGAFRRRRPVLVAGLVVVAAGLLLCALPVGLAGLIAGRALQGVGLALAPLAIAVARDALPSSRVSAAIATLSVSAVAGAGLGYPLTAVLVEQFGLATAYGVGLVATLAALVLTVVAVPGSSRADESDIDWTGAALLASGSLAILLVISEADAWGWLSPATGAVAAGAVVLLIAWTRRSLRIPHPLVDLGRAGHGRAAAAHVGAVVLGAGTYLMIGIVMVVAQAPSATGYGVGLSLTTAGLLLVPYSLANVIGSRLSLVAGDRLRPELVLPVGSGIWLLASLTLALWHDSVASLFTTMLVAGLGGGFTFAALPRLIVSSVPMLETGSAMGFNQLLRYVGFSVGSALCPLLLGLFTQEHPTHVVAGVVLCAGALFALSAAVTSVLAAHGRAVPATADRAR